MTLPGQLPKMTAVDSQLIESVAYMPTGRKLYVKFRNGRTMCIENVPQFRFSGLMASPRIDAYFNSYIKDQFLAKDLPPPAV